MRNDARPIGEHSPASPVGGDARPLEREQPTRNKRFDERPGSAGRPENIVNRDPGDEDQSSKEESG